MILAYHSRLRGLDEWVSSARSMSNGAVTAAANRAQRAGVIPAKRPWSANIGHSEFLSPEAEIAMLAVKVLREREHFALKPAVLVRHMVDSWEGDAQRAPGRLTFVRQFPALFEALHRRDTGPSPNKTVNELLIEFERRKRQGAAAGSREAALSHEPVAQEQEAEEETYLGGPTLIRLTLLGRRYRGHLLNQWTNSALATVWGEGITHILKEAGGSMKSSYLVFRLQKHAVQHNLPLPPAGIAWVLLSKLPEFAHFRPIWEEQRMAGAQLTERPALEIDFEELKEVAARLRKAEEPAAARLDSVQYSSVGSTGMT